MKTKADRYREVVDRHLESGVAGTGVMVSIIALSAILSAIFFWRHSSAVFAGIPVFLAVVLGLLIGLIPSEGAFFGWKKIRTTKTDMTKWQLRFSAAGLWAGVIFAVANVISVFITSFPEIPAAIQDMAGWIVFFALLLPIPTQFMLYAGFTVTEQAVVEAANKAALSAAKHSAQIAADKARIGAILEGTDAELETSLDAYGSEVGRDNAHTALRDGERDILGQYYARQSTVGKNTHHAAPPPYPAAGQGEPVYLTAAEAELLARIRHDAAQKMTAAIHANGQEPKPANP